MGRRQEFTSDQGSWYTEIDAIQNTNTRDNPILNINLFHLLVNYDNLPKIFSRKNSLDIDWKPFSTTIRR